MHFFEQSEIYGSNYYYNPFAVKLDRCIGSCNTLHDVYVPKKTEYLNLSMFNMITGINEKKILTKHI